MCILKRTNKLLLIVPLLVEVFTLEVVPIEKNVILKTEYIIRNVTNNIFVELKLKGVKNNTRLQQHNIVHNFFTKLGVADQHTLAAVHTVSRFDKTNINYKTQAFMDILNEVLQEDWINDEDKSLTNNVNVLKFISNYLSGGDHENLAEKQNNLNEVIKNLETELAEENMTEKSNEDSIYGRNNETEENEFWSPGFSGRRIYQGKRTKIKHFPFMASIQIFKSFQCGGSIIKSDLILTAASCLQLAYNNRFFRENPAFLSVNVGSDFYQGSGDNIEALEVYFEPGYDPKTLKNNLALIRLQRKINFKTKRVKRIDIDREANKVPFNSGPLTIIGWGARTSSNILDNPWSNRLSYADQAIYHYRDCEDIYTKEYVTRTNFCAGSAAKGSGACNKDAGDPGVIAGILVGVASFGSPVCGTPDVPTVFTKVGYYADWIDEIMEQRVPTRKKFTTTESPYRPHTPDLHKEMYSLTKFDITPIVGTESPVAIQKVYTESPLLLRKKKKEQDEELKDILYNMIDDKNDPGNLRDRIEEMLPKIKKYATSTRSTTEAFLTTDIGSQKHTVMDRILSEDFNISQIIDRLDGGDDNLQDQLMIQDPGKKKSEVKTTKLAELIDVYDQHGGIETGLKKVEAFHLGPIDNDIKGIESGKQHTPKKSKKIAKKGKLKTKNQNLKKDKLRDRKQDFELPEISVKPLQLPEAPVKKQPVPKNIKYQKMHADYNDDIENKYIEKQIKLLQDQLKQPLSNFNIEPTNDDIVEPDSTTNDKDGLAAIDDTSITETDELNTGDGLGAKVYELAAEVDSTLKEGSPRDQGKVKKNSDGFQETLNVGKGAIKIKDEIVEYGEFDYNPAVNHDQKDKKEGTEDVLTLLYLSSEEANKGKKNNKENIKEKNDAEQPLKDLIDNKGNDGLEVVDEFFKVPVKNNAKKTSYHNLPRDKLYNLLTEAINDMTSKKRSNQ